MTTKTRPATIQDEMGTPVNYPVGESQGPDADYERMLSALRAGGHRITAPRRAMLRLLAAATHPISVPEMCARVNELLSRQGGTQPHDPDPVNLATAYRFANLLVEMHLARRVEFGQGYYRYERDQGQSGPHHHHIICERCGRMEEFTGCDVAPLAARVENESGFRIARHQLEMYGLCPTCQSVPA